AEWTGAPRGTAPGLSNVGQAQLRPPASSPLVSAGNPQPPAPSAFPFPSPLLLPQFDAPQRAKLAIGAQVARVPGARIDIGAMEAAGGGGARLRRNGSQPLPPPRTSGPRPPAARASQARAAGAHDPSPARR